MAIEDKNIPRWKKMEKEQMEQEIEYLAFYDEGEEFPPEEVAKTLEQLNLGDNPGYRYDNARTAE